MEGEGLPSRRVQHGHPSSYNFETIFACCKVGLGNDYSAVPAGAALKDVTPASAAGACEAQSYGGHSAHTDRKRLVER
jgi:hypothetical protein